MFDFKPEIFGFNSDILSATESSQIEWKKEPQQKKYLAERVKQQRRNGLGRLSVSLSCISIT